MIKIVKNNFQYKTCVFNALSCFENRPPREIIEDYRKDNLCFSDWKANDFNTIELDGYIISRGYHPVISLFLDDPRYFSQTKLLKLLNNFEGLIFTHRHCTAFTEGRIFVAFSDARTIFSQKRAKVDGLYLTRHFEFSIIDFINKGDI